MQQRRDGFGTPTGDQPHEHLYARSLVWTVWEDQSWDVCEGLCLYPRGVLMGGLALQTPTPLVSAPNDLPRLGLTRVVGRNQKG